MQQVSGATCRGAGTYTAAAMRMPAVVALSKPRLAYPISPTLRHAFRTRISQRTTPLRCGRPMASARGAPPSPRDEGGSTRRPTADSVYAHSYREKLESAAAAAAERPPWQRLLQAVSYTAAILALACVTTVRSAYAVPLQ